MGDKSKIQWTDSTWNPVTGCDKVSAGCKNCYAESQALRLQKMGQPNYRNGFRVTLQPHMLEIPLRQKRPRTYFVNSMSDLFHPEVSTDYIRQVLDVCRRAPQHTFQILTKRAYRMREVVSELLPEPLPNVWLGVSVEDAKAQSRIQPLLETPADVRFLSVEPFIGSLDLLELDPKGLLHWAIFGGESGPNAREMYLVWLAEGLRWCRNWGVAPFVKQLGTVWAKQNGCKHPKAGDPSEWPEWARIREFPQHA